MTRLNVSMDDTLVKELRRAVPTRQRSRFISEAVREKLVQLEQQRAVREAAGLWGSENRGDPDEEIRKLRGAWKNRQEDLEGGG